METDKSSNTNNVLLPEDIEKNSAASEEEGRSSDNRTTDHTAPTETDKSNNTNNVLLPEDIEKNSAASEEEGGSSDLPGAFPETPAAEEFRVAPIPASAGWGNPIRTRPGEPVPSPSNFTNKSVNDTATYDQESYEKSGSVAPPQLPNPITPDEERAANGGMFGLTEDKDNIIPESGLPMGAGAGVAADDAAAINSGPTIQSAAPESTTAQLAGQVPLEPKRAPEIVKDSQAEASADPEASANSEALQNKSAVENELSKIVPKEPATSESTVSGKAMGIAAEAAVGAGAAATATAAYLSSGSAAQDAKSKLPVSAHEYIDKLTTSDPNGSAKDVTPIAPTVPDTVQKSIEEAYQAPEAAANSEAVQEKSQVETELLRKVGKEEATGEPAPIASAAIAPTVPDTVQQSIMEAYQAPEAAANSKAVQEKSQVESELLEKVGTEEATGEPAPMASLTTATTVPDTVQQSIAEAHQAPEAAANNKAVQGKSQVESELLEKVGTEDAAGEPAPTVTAATATTAPAPLKSTEEPLSETKTVEPAAEKDMTAAATAGSASAAAPTMAASTAAPTISTTPPTGLNFAPTSPTQSESLAAPAAAPAKTAVTEENSKLRIDSRDVSPMSRPVNEPTVTSGVSSSTTPQKSTAATASASTPTPSSPKSSRTSDSSPATDRKSKRRSFFGKLKDKLEHRKDKA
ncbi:MAG: hypothetical protein LQ340_001780 [Diploschistes diacapsis]|nr:MAG: hypothetical protein LQ340_001780 [Diploschistes diacapsis]